MNDRNLHLHDHKRGTSSSGFPSGHLTEWPEVALDYLDGRLDLKTKAVLEAHLSTCPNCRACLERQRVVSQLLHDLPLEPVPTGLEQLVLHKVTKAVSPQPTRVAHPSVIHRETAHEEPSWWSLIWKQRVRPWLPATVAVAALLLAILGYGLLRTGAADQSEYAGSKITTTSAPATATTLVGARAPAEAGEDTESTSSYQESALTTLASPLSATGEPVTSTAVMGGKTTEATAALTTTTEGMRIAAIAPPVSDRKGMISALSNAQSPVYFVFASAEAEGPILRETSESVVLQMVNLTGLQPLEDSLAMGGPTFAAYLPREEAGPFVDLLLSIRASLQLHLHLDFQPPEATPERTAQLLQHKQGFPELSATHTPPPAVSAWSFTTSTLSQVKNDQVGTVQTPDEAGTHVLVIVLVRQ